MVASFRKLKTAEWNAVIVALFLFQYSILAPAMDYINSSALIAASGLLLVAALLTRNVGRPVNTQVAARFALTLLLLLLNAIFTGAGAQGLGVFLLIALPVVVLFLFDFDFKTFLHSCCTLSAVSFFILALYPFLPRYAYMRFGYGMLPVVLFAYIALVYPEAAGYKRRSGKRTLFFLAVLGLGLLEILLYGARGTLVSIGLFCVTDRLLVNKRKVLGNALLIALAGGALAFIVPILDRFEALSKKIGIYSYSITKLKMQLAGGFASASSGRMKIYMAALEKIRLHPWIGNGLNTVENGNYAHNLFLQVGTDLGAVAVIAVTVFLIAQLIAIGTKRRTIQDKLIREILFSISIGRLLFSSTLWRRPEFWMLFFFAAFTKRARRGTSAPAAAGRPRDALETAEINENTKSDHTEPNETEIRGEFYGNSTDEREAPA